MDNKLFLKALYFIFFLTLQFNFLPSLAEVVEEVEPNNLIYKAQSISLPVTIKGNLDKRDPGQIRVTTYNDESLIVQDLYTFFLDKESDVEINLSFDKKNTDLDLVIFRNNGRKIVNSSSNSESNIEQIKQKLEAGSYLVGVLSYDGNSDYLLNIETTTGLNGSKIILMVDGLKEK